MARARSAFGKSSVNRVRSALDRCGAGSEETKIAVALCRAESGSLFGVMIRYALASALGLTLVVLALVVPGSTEVGLAGW